MLLELGVAEASTKNAGDRCGMMIDQIDGDGDVGARSVRQGECGIHESIIERDCAGFGQINVAPDARVSATDRWKPTPADGSVIGRVVCAEGSAIFAGALEAFLLAASGCGVLFDAHCKGVWLIREQLAGDVEASAHEAAFDAAEFLSVEEDVGLPVNAVEVEPCDFAAFE